MPNPTSKLNLVINGATTQLDIHDANAVDLNSNQTVAGNKEFTGTTTAHDLVPSATDTYNFGSPSYQWNNAYIKSLTVNGTQFLPSDYVTLNTTQTITSKKNYTNYQDISGYRLRIKSPAQEKGVIPASNLWNGFVFCDKNNETMFSIEQGMMPNGAIQLNFSGRANDNDTTYTTFLRYINNSDLTINFVNIIDLIPIGNGTRKLGDTNAKWKSFNGINPGALSLPSNSYVNVDTTNWDVAGGTNVYTPPANGWLHIRVVGATELMVRWTGWRFGDRRVSATATDLGVTIPVVAGVTVDVATVASGFDGKCQFFPCQGNV